MMKQLLHSTQEIFGKWWASLLMGVVAIILGILSVMIREESLTLLTYLFVSFLFIKGSVKSIRAIQNKQVVKDWGWKLASGILELFFSIYLILIPHIFTRTIVVYAVGFGLLVSSILIIEKAFKRLPQSIKEWGWLFVIGLFSLTFSIIYLFNPLHTEILMISLVCISLLIFGFFRIFKAFRQLLAKVESEN